jgi:hypothetical protein
MTSSSGDVTKRDFYLDGACSAHVCNRRDVFQTFLPLKDGVRKVNGFEGSEKSAKGIGTIRLPMRLPSGKVSYAVIQNVLYIPESVNLISQDMIMDRGIRIELINGYGANLYSNTDEMVATAPQIHRMLPFDIAWEHMPRFLNTACAVSAEGISTTLGGACDCHSCLRGEHSRKSFTPLPLGNRAVEN